MDLMQQWCAKVGVTKPVNGSWLFAIAENLSIDLNGDLWRNIAVQSFGITEPINGSWIQAIAEKLGAREPKNGSWLKAIVDKL
jgi:predicted small secreted protein